MQYRLLGSVRIHDSQCFFILSSYPPILLSYSPAIPCLCPFFFNPPPASKATTPSSHHFPTSSPTPFIHRLDLFISPSLSPSLHPFIPPSPPPLPLYLGNLNKVTYPNNLFFFYIFISHPLLSNMKRVDSQPPFSDTTSESFASFS